MSAPPRRDTAARSPTHRSICSHRRPALLIIDRICAASSSGVVMPFELTTSSTVMRGSLSRDLVTATMTAVCAPDSFP